MEVNRTEPSPLARVPCSYPLSFRNFSVLVNVGDLFQGLPDFFEQGLGHFILGMVNFPAAHVADLVLGPQEVVVRQVAVVVQVWKCGEQSLKICMVAAGTEESMGIMLQYI